MVESLARRAGSPVDSEELIRLRAENAELKIKNERLRATIRDLA